jgi:uncharacterized protein YutD
LKQLNVLDASGHTTLEVGKDSLTQDDVDRKFEELVTKGYLTYKVGDQGAEQVRSLGEVKDAERVVAHGPLAGG